MKKYLTDMNFRRLDYYIWKVLMRFLDLPPWTNCSKGLEFTSILLTSFFFVRKHRQQMSGLLLSNWYWMTKVLKIWWDFLTCLLEQIVLRGLNSPASFWLLPFFFFFIDNKWANCSYWSGLWSKWDIFFWKQSKNDLTRFLEWQKSKIWKVLMRFLDLPPWTNRSKGLEFHRHPSDFFLFYS